jgi:hypothetical protein
MELYTEDTSRTVLDMDQALKFGQMAPSMRESGDLTKLMETVNFGMQMAMFTKDSGRMTRLMVMVFTFMLMVQSMKATGKMISKTEQE